MLAALLARSAAATAMALPPIGDWQGHYKCAQGETALDLEISATTPSKIDAIFYFHAQQNNPGVPQGCFMMHGSFEAAARMVTLSPAEWLDRPAFFVSVGLGGTVSPSGDTLSGRISGPGCAGFSLTRSFAPPVPPAPAPCRDTRQGPVT